MGLRAMLLRRGGALWRDERATTLTEFVMTLPIFITIFIAIGQLGLAGRSSTEAWGTAYRQLWYEVVPVTRQMDVAPSAGDPTQVYVHPTPAGADALQKVNAQPPVNDYSGLAPRVRLQETQTYGAMAAGGTFGESNARTQPSAGHFNFARTASHRSGSASDIVGNSGFAHDMVNDSPSRGNFQLGLGQGPDGALGHGLGLRAVLGAGNRYGTAAALVDSDFEIMGWQVPMKVYFNTLVPPSPVQGDGVATAISRLSLGAYDPYGELLGIAVEQPLPTPGAPSVPELD
ncbi:hypothetical protein DL240_08045 [Lujinxingia litoralis]|uniref:Uncharacterized protein n=1 Tax=Lujinxingia litoralis TaxID=2211119 RepID=A0A328C9J7_9DELT|nr:hypothetical protein [Lujinxingia litoralis]RAL22835.1 hypothetical protein DL240_08045 [Lujinxingia litoralis]